MGEITLKTPNARREIHGPYFDRPATDGEEGAWKEEEEKSKQPEQAEGHDDETPKNPKIRRTQRR